MASSAFYLNKSAFFLASTASAFLLAYISRTFFFSLAERDAGAHAHSSSDESFGFFPALHLASHILGLLHVFWLSIFALSFVLATSFSS